MTRTAIVAGALASKPNNGGEAWVRLSWIHALEELGFRVAFVEDGVGHSAEATAFFDAVVAEHHRTGPSYLLSRDRQAAYTDLARADVLFNISGNLSDPTLMNRCRRRVYVDVDPVYTQIWHRQGLLGTQLEAHHHHLTVGLNIGRQSCAVPDDGIHWYPILPPTVARDWPCSGPPERPMFTTIAAWRGGYGRVDLEGVLLGQKAHEFRRFIEFPTTSPWPVELALLIDPADTSDSTMLADAGFDVVDPRVTDSPERFRRYLQRSAAEFSVAQGAYVTTRSGWFSDRSARYLMSGRPVLVQDTGLGELIPGGRGVFAFQTLDDAAEQARDLVRNYDMYRRLARSFALEHLSPAHTLAPVLDQWDVA